MINCLNPFSTPKKCNDEEISAHDVSLGTSTLMSLDYLFLLKLTPMASIAPLQYDD